MYAGIAGALLVFTGIWHAVEWLMDGRRLDTLKLILPGIIYLGLGCFIVGGIGGTATLIAAIVLPAAGGVFAYFNRNKMDVRRWVIWAFIIIDVMVVLAAVAALLDI